MRRVEVIQWRPFFQGKVIPKNSSVVLRSTSAAMTVVVSSKVISALSAVAEANSSGSWSSFFSGVLGVSDWVCVGVIIFSGLNWMFANRSKAMEYLIGGSAGYLLIRHSKEIQEWLKGI